MQNYINYNNEEDYIKKEKIDGKIYLMSPPCREHRFVQGNLQSVFNNYFKQKKKRCIAIFEDQLDTDDDEWVLPDLMVFCYENSKDIPMIIIEVLSNSTRERDLGVKMKKYAALGIKEYWVITWETYSVDIYLLSNEEDKSKHYELYKSYAYLKLMPQRRKNFETGEYNPKPEIIKEFSPVSIPELKIKLEDVFYFID